VRLSEPALAIGRGGGLPFLVEHWFLGTRTRRYMMVRRYREVLEHAALEPGQRVLDLGCGWAYGTRWVHKLDCRPTGVDLELDQLRWARGGLECGKRLELVQANAKALPFRDASFDRVVSVEMMEHVFRPDRERVIGEIARVLRPGGRLSLSTPNAISPIETLKRLAVRWPALRRRLPSSCFPESGDDARAYHPYRYHHPLSLRELTVGLERAGLRVVGARRFLWVPKTLPDPMLTPARVAERAAETLPVINRLGATSLVWAVRA